MRHLPNLITLLRLALVPVTAYCIAAEAYGFAVAVFLIAALSDLADGFLARRFKVVSKLGALLDPIADKLNMLVATVALAWQDLVPLWLAIAIIGRDIVIVTGAIAYRLVAGHLTMRPTYLSKVNTVLEFGVLLLVMGAAAGWIGWQGLLPLLFAVLLATVVASGMQYVWLWGRAALASQRAP